MFIELYFWKYKVLKFAISKIVKSFLTVRICCRRHSVGSSFEAFVDVFCSAISGPGGGFSS